MRLAKCRRDERSYCDETSHRHINVIVSATSVSQAGQGLSLTFITCMLDKAKGLGSIRGYFGLNIFEKIECVCLLGFKLTLSKRYYVFLEMTSALLIVPLLW